MRKLRVLLLMHQDMMPPEGVKEAPTDRFVPWKTDFDVHSGLEDLGHEVVPLGVESDLAPIREGIRELEPHVVFNLLEAFHGIPSYNQYVTSFLELLKQPYTGCNPRGLMLARDKALCRKVLTYHRIPGPRFAVFPRGRGVRKLKRLRYPLMVKTLSSDGSIGLSQDSIVDTQEKLQERVRYLQETFDLDVIVEEYILGREMYVGVLGNRRLTTLPVIELNFGNLPPGTQPIATSKVKWDPKYQKERKISLKPADLPQDLEKRLLRTAKRVYRSLDLSGYGRIDFRVTEDGGVFPIEANPNCDLGYGEEFAEAAELAKMSYPALLQRILNLGLRYPAEWRELALGG